MQGAGNNFLFSQTPSVPDEYGTVNISDESNFFSETDLYPGPGDSYSKLLFQQSGAALVPFTNNGQIGSQEKVLRELDASEIGQFINTGSIDWSESLTFSTLSNQNGSIAASSLSDSTITVAGDVLNQGANAVINGAETFSIGGDLTNGTDSRIENIGSLAVDGSLTQTGTLDNNTNISVTGDLSNTTGVISNSDTLVAANIFNTSEISDVKNITSNGILTNTGTISDVSGVLTATTSLTNSNEISNVDVITTTGTLTNSGTITGVTTRMSASLVANNGTLEDVAAVVGSVQNNNLGIIRLSPGTAGTEMVITNGNLTNNGGTFEIDIDSTTGAADLFVVNGTAAIDGGTVVITDIAGDSGQYKANDEYLFLHSSGLTVENPDNPLTVDFHSTNLSPLLVARGEYNAENYYLKIARAREYAPGATTYNQTHFGEYLDDLGENFVPGSDLENVLEQLDALSPTEEITPEARHAMAELDGAVYGSLASLGVQHQTIVNQQLADFLRPTTPDSYGCCPNKNLWGKYYRVDGDTEFDGNAFGGDSTVNGVIAGFDGMTTENFRFGGFFAYGQSDYSVNGLSESADTVSYKAGIYFLQANNNDYFIGNVNYGYDEYDVTRHINFLDRTCTGETDGNQWSVRIEKGFNRSLGKALIQPFGAFQFVTLEMNEMSETGGGAASLELGESTFDSYRSDVGVRALWSRLLSKGQTGSLNFKGSWLHEFGDTHGAVVGQFSNPNSANFTGTVSPYTVNGVDLGRDWCNLGVGGDFTVSSTTVFAGYDFLFNGDQNLHTANVGVACRF